MSRKLTAVLIVVTAGLTFAATSPRRSLTLVMTPKTLMNEMRQMESRMEWSEMQERASQGDTYAMFEVGMEMTRRWGKEDSGIPYNMAAARAMLREAADRGHFPSRLALWNAEGGSAAELHALLSARPEAEALGALRQAKFNYLKPAFEECHPELRDLGLELWRLGIDRYLAFNPADSTEMRAEWSQTEGMFRALFREKCETQQP